MKSVVGNIIVTKVARGDGLPSFKITFEKKGRKDLFIHLSSKDLIDLYGAVGCFLHKRRGKD